MKPLNLIRSVKATHENRLLAQAGVTGVDIGPKIVNGQKTEETAIRVYVQKKKKSVPAGEAIPPEIEGVRTDVIEAKFVLHAALSVKVEDVRIMADTGTYNPLVGGISIGPCKAVGGFVFVGTLGCMVRDRSTGERLMLSNYHVLAEKWAAGDTVAQPSRVDGGTCPAKVVGTLVRSTLSEKVDGAVGNLNSSRTNDCSIHEVGDVKGKTTAVKDMNVRKRGRTTGLTYGTVESIDASVKVPYDDGDHILKHQILIEVDTGKSTVFGQGGDSGSVVVDDGNRVVGLYFAGTEDGLLGVANPIDAVLDELNIDLCTKAIVKPIHREKWIRPEKLWWSEGFKDRFKEVAYDKPPISEGLDWRWDWLINPPDFTPPITGPTQPGFAGAGETIESPAIPSVEERLARLEAMAGGSGQAASTPLIRPTKRVCADFRSGPLGFGPNPRNAAYAEFQVLDYTNSAVAQSRIVNWGGMMGLDVGFRTIVTHPACSLITLTLVHWSQPAKALGYNAAGTLVASASMAATQGVDQVLTLNAAGIVRVEIHALQNETVLRRYCHCMPLVKPIKEWKEPKEIKEFKEPKEFKEVKEFKDVKECKEPKEIFEGGLNPGLPNPSGQAASTASLSVEERLSRLESLLASPHFIGSDLRPDLSAGAMIGEPDHPTGTC